MKRSFVTLQDIADRLGVSKAAVASVLSPREKSTVRVGDALRRKIKATAQSLNYVPRSLVRTANGYSSGLIGVLVDSCAPPVVLAFLAHLERRAASLGFRIVTGQSHDNTNHLLAVFDTLSRHWVDGVICLAHDYPKAGRGFARFFDSRDDVVFFGGPVVPGHRQVVSDIGAGVAAAARLLKSNGCRKIALLAHADESDAIRRRVDGFLTVFPKGQDRVFRLDLDASDPDRLRDAIRGAVRDIAIANGADGLLISNDISALPLLGALAEAGFRIPADIQVVGYDNCDFSAYSLPPLTTVDWNLPVLADKAMGLLMEIILLPPARRPPPRLVLVPPTLVERETTARRLPSGK